MVARRRPHRVHLRSQRRARPLRDVACRAATHRLPRRCSKPPEHKNMSDWSDRWAIHPLHGPEPRRERHLGPAAVWGSHAHAGCTTRSVRVARASRPTADGWPMSRTKAAGPKSTCSRFQTPPGRRRFRPPAARRRVWRGDGGELYFRSPDDRLMAARIGSSGTEHRHGDAVRVVRAASRPGSRGHVASWYAASRDGQRFLVNTYVEGASPITVLLNWKPGN